MSDEMRHLPIRSGRELQRNEEGCRFRHPPIAIVNCFSNFIYCKKRIKASALFYIIFCDQADFNRK